jgi:hypothetical protein
VNAVAQISLHKRQALSDWLEVLGAQFDLTPTEHALARDRYTAVGRWLADSNHPWMAGAQISVHGSIALGTIIRAVGRDEFDADALSHLPAVPANSAPAVVKQVVGARLREHAVYKDLLEEFPRCWRLNYTNDFHLDITPSMDHPVEPEPAIIVPDKRLQRWMPSNPHGFRQRFAARADLVPRFYGIFAKDARGAVGEFPIFSGPQGVLRRTVQLLKRHRDIEFQDLSISDLRPISIIITTLAACAYEHCVMTEVFETDFDLLVAVIAAMPSFLRIEQRGVTAHYVLENETVPGENFAEKWNECPKLARAFFSWHAAVLKAMARLATAEGFEELERLSSLYFGDRISRCTLTAIVKRTERARHTRALVVAPSVGLSTARAGAVPVAQNTFFGRR